MSKMVTITCLPGASRCLKSHNSPLFDLKNISPGLSSSPVIVSVANLDPRQACSLQISTSNPIGDSRLLDNLFLSATLPNFTVSEATFSQPLKLGVLPPNTSIDYGLSVSMPPDSGNIFQGKSLNLDFDFDFLCQVPVKGGEVLGVTQVKPNPGVFRYILIISILIFLWFLFKRKSKSKKSQLVTD